MSKNKAIGNGGRGLMNIMKGLGLEVLNGKTKGDWEGEYTYVGVRASTVIDYIFVNEKIRHRVVEFKIEDRVDSDHMPISLKLEAEEERRGTKSKKEKGKRKRRR